MKIFSTKLYINWLQIDWLGGGSLSRCSSQLWKCNGAGHSSQLQKIKVVFFVHKGDWVKMSVVWYGGPVVCLASSQCPSQVAELSNCIIQYTLEPLSWLNSFEIPSLFFFLHPNIDPCDCASVLILSDTQRWFAAKVISFDSVHISDSCRCVADSSHGHHSQTNPSPLCFCKQHHLSWAHYTSL